MKELIQQLSSFNLWANQLMVEAVKTLPVEKQLQTIPSSFESLQKTIIHMWDAESIWWQRLKLSERIDIPSTTFAGNTSEAGDQLIQLDRQWNDWISGAQEHILKHVFLYQNSKREQFKQPIYQMLLHLFNHNTYHRGQLVNMLRQLNIEKIPQTDFIVWARKR
ncbi:MAG TPA: DinB family protein [Flavisolibacter sp.]|jgi:uncharacterized damage-inducible protein DinB|nr:DinB family protein [Flavisolibacter sp.]